MITARKLKERKDMNKNDKVIIWRKSIYDNDYVCKCGKKLLINDDVAEDMLYDQNNKELICPNCMWNVAKVTTYEKAVKIGAMFGGQS